jgi:ribose transport system substrate-binding protein
VDHSLSPPDSSRGSGNRFDRYYVELVGKTLDILDTLRHEKRELRLTEIAERAGLDKATAFRILRTLEQRRYVLRDPGTKKFRLAFGYRFYRIGYAQLSSEEPFSQAVTAGIVEEAARWQVEIVVLDNRADGHVAIENARRLAEEHVDFVIEYQVCYRVAPMLADIFARARIPAMAIDIPQPGAIYFGADNYHAGIIGGEALGEFARRRWRGQVDRVLLLELPQAGRTPQSRILGTLRGIRNILPHFKDQCVLHRDAKGTEQGAYQATLKVLKNRRSREHLLIAAVNDSCALGALRAVRESGRESRTAIIGHGFGPDLRVRDEIRKPGSPLIGSVAYYPERYGAKILPIVLRWLNREQVPPTVHIDHSLVTRDNLDSCGSVHETRTTGSPAAAAIPGL